MEYERALYRVYEGCLEGLLPNTNDNTIKTCLIIEKFTFFLFLIFCFILSILHFIYVNSTGCLPEVLNNYSLNYYNITTFNFTNDQIIQININSSLSPYYKHNKYNNKNNLNFNNLIFQGLLDEYNLNYDNNNDSIINNTTNSSNYIHNNHNKTFVNNNNTNLTTEVIKMRLPDYEFSKFIELLSLTPEIREKHKFQLIPITLNSDCFGPTSIQSLVPFGGFDVIINNFIMSTFPNGGSIRDGNRKIISWKNLDQSHPKYFTAWLELKISIFFKSVFLFFILSAATALLIRILISSGVVLLIPFFSLFHVRSLSFIYSFIHSSIYIYYSILF